MKIKDVLSLIVGLIFIVGLFLVLEDEINNVPLPPLPDAVSPLDVTLRTVGKTHSGLHLTIEEASEKEFDILFITPDLLQKVGTLPPGTKLNFYIRPTDFDQKHVTLWGVAKTDDGEMLLDPDAEVTKKVRLKFYTPPPPSYTVRHTGYALMGLAALYFAGLGCWIMGRRYLPTPPETQP